MEMVKYSRSTELQLGARSLKIMECPILPVVSTTLLPKNVAHSGDIRNRKIYIMSPSTVTVIIVFDYSFTLSASKETMVSYNADKRERFDKWK